MIFSSAEYPIFLFAVFFLYFGLRFTKWPGAIARLCLLLLLGDLVYLLLSQDLNTLWDPLGALLFRTLSQDPPPLKDPLSYLIGFGVFSGSILLGFLSHRWLEKRSGQSFTALFFTICLSVIGGFIVYYAWIDSIQTLTDLFSDIGHLIYLFGLGLSFGVSLKKGGRPLGRLFLLFLLSAVFYHAWSSGMPNIYKYLILIVLGTIVLDYYLALWVYRSKTKRSKKILLVISLVSNLGILAVFKYLDFFLISVSDFLLLLNIETSWEPFGLILPAGISFHTFQSLSYTIDVYKEKIKPTHSVMEFATYVLLFPQLIAGPIVRAHEFLPQLRKEPILLDHKAAEGLFRILIGLLKKVVLADFLAYTLVDRVFAQPHLFSSIEVLFAVYGYALQIYLDFSAYSDIAIGSAQLLGFRFPENFRTPYRSGDIQEFWRRWHITLSSWLRDYLYIPLGGSKGTSWFTYRNLMITMLLGGLWHGANWTFIVWGALHGGGLAMTRVWQRCKPAFQNRIILPVLAGSILGSCLHLFLLVPFFEKLGEMIFLDPDWLHLCFAWIYLTPSWALLCARLSHKPPLFTSSVESYKERVLRPRFSSVLFFAGGVLCWGIGAFSGSLGLEIGALYSLTAIAVWIASQRLIKTTPLNALSFSSWIRFLCQPQNARPLWFAFVGCSVILLRIWGEVPLWVFASILFLWFCLACLASAAKIAPGEKDAIQYLQWFLLRIFAVLLTFHYVCFAWIFFRATSFSIALEMIHQLGTFTWDAVNISTPFFYAFLVGLVAHFFPDTSFSWLRERFISLPYWARILLIFAVAVLLKELSNPNVVPFIYFQF